MTLTDEPVFKVRLPMVKVVPESPESVPPELTVTVPAMVPMPDSVPPLLTATPPRLLLIAPFTISAPPSIVVAPV